MSGGLLQLVAYGSQDIYLTGNASISFFKSVYRRHTSFSLEDIECTWNGSVGFNKRVSCTIPRNGDLLHSLWLEVTLKKGAGESFYAGESFIKEYELEIGGQRIDKWYSDALQVFNQLYRNETQKASYRRLVDFDRPGAGEDTGVIKKFYIPLNLWFTKSPGLSLPLVALQYHEVRLNVQFEAAGVMSTNGVDTSYEPTCTLYAGYTYLDQEERKRMSQQSSEYLITTLQHTGSETVTPGASAVKTTNIRLNYNHPVKNIAFVLKGNKHGEYTTGARGTDEDKFAPVYQAKLQLNGHDRADIRDGSYYNQVQAFSHCEGAKPSAGIYMYSFSLRPTESVQPSGSCNFSRIDNATLVLTTKKGSISGNVSNHIVNLDETFSNVTNLTTLNVYCESYNILRILSGMGGLAYS